VRKQEPGGNKNEQAQIDLLLLRRGAHLVK
jgi:hypothetical protein